MATVSINNIQPIATKEIEKKINKITSDENFTEIINSIYFVPRNFHNPFRELFLGADYSDTRRFLLLDKKDEESDKFFLSTESKNFVKKIKNIISLPLFFNF